MNSSTGEAGKALTPDSVLNATLTQLNALRVRDKAPALTETALKLARTMDSTTSARDLSGLAREFRTVLAELEQIALESPAEVDAVDEIAARRAERIREVVGPAGEGRSTAPPG